MFSKRALLCGVIALFAGCVPDAVALDVDFDADLIQLQLFLGSSFTLRNVDGDANGLKEDDQLGMLSQILAGGAPVSCIDAGRLSAIQSAYTFNFNEVANHVTVNISGVGTVNLLTQVQDVNPALGDALRQLIAGILTIADTETVAYVNSIADQVVAQVLKGTPQEDETPNVQDQITFLASDFQIYGSAGDEPNYLGADGDIDQNAESNLAEYEGLAEKTRENWLTACCITPALRIVNFSGGGTKVTGLQLNFSVSAAGEAGPVTYQWFKGPVGGGTLVGSGSTYAIAFTNTSDSGSYYAVLSDGVYTRTTPAVTLSVTYVPLFITQQISGGTRVEGASKTFTVGVQGGQPGPYTYAWKKGVDPIPSATGPSYTIPVLSASDSGQYSVTVSSNGGADAVTSGPTTLTVNAVSGLTIATQPASVSKAIGESHTFSLLVVGGSGNYTYTWRKNSAPIGAPSQNSLAINNITGANAGVYSCIVNDTTQGTSVTSQNATLTVTGGLTVTTQPQGKNLALGGSHTLTVAVSGGSGNYDYQWLKDGTPIDTPSALSYLIEDATADDTGDYACFISDVNNPTISVLSNTVTVTISLGGLTITEQPQGGTRFVGENVQLSVTVTGGGGPGEYTYDWRKEGVSLGAPSSSTLNLENVTVENSGAYRCRVTDTSQSNVSILSNIANITVIDASPLTIEEQPMGGYGYTGEPFTFSINVFGGSGSYDFTWLRDGGPACEDCNGPTLNIDSLSFGDGGEYQCIVSDQQYTDLEIASDIVVLEVGADLAVSTPPQGGNFVAGESHVLNCVVTGGIGELFYSWEHDGEPVSGAENSPVLDLKVLRLAEAGEYVCVISDFFRQIRSETAVINVSLVDVPEGDLNYNLSMNGDNAVPPVSTFASGTAIGKLARNSADPADGATLTYNTVQTVGDAQQLLLFAGADDVNGEVMLNFGPALVAQAGTVQLTEEEASIIFAGYAYFAVTSGAYPNGEIRVQVAVDYEPPASSHISDQNNDNVISLSELLRVIQFYNSLGLHCDINGEDGFAPGAGDESCTPHDSDYAPVDWVISLSELLRLIQFYNTLAYHPCEGSEDGFCPGAG